MATNPNIVVSATDRASGVLKGIGSQVDAMTPSVSRLSAAFGALGIATAVAATVAAGVRSMVGALDDLDEAAQAVGVTAVALADLRLAASESGVGAEKLEGALGKLNVKIADANAGNKTAIRLFRDLGVAYKDAAGDARSTEDVLRDIAKSFSTAGDGAGKSALAIEAFGKSGAALVPYLNQGADGLRKFSGVTEENVENSKRLQGEIDKLSASYDRLKLSISGAVAAGVNRILDAAAAQDTDRQIQVLTKRLAQLRNELTTQKNPEFLQAINIEMADIEVRLKALNALGIDRFLAGANALRRMETAQLKKSDDDTDKKKERTKVIRDLTEVQRTYQAQIDRELRNEGDRRGLEFINLESDAYKKAGDNAKRLDDIVDDLTGRTRRNVLAEQIKLIDDRFFEGKITIQEYDIALRKLFGTDVQKDIEKTTESARELSLVFSSALGDFIDNPGQSNFVEALAKDIQKLITQLLIVRPLAEGLEEIFGGKKATSSGGKEVAGYGAVIGELLKSVIGSFATGTDYVPRTGLALVHQGERIIPAAQNKVSGAGISVTNNFTISGNVTRATQGQIAAEVARSIAIANRRHN